MEAPGFWDDQRAAARVSSERARVQRQARDRASSWRPRRRSWTACSSWPPRSRSGGTSSERRSSRLGGEVGQAAGGGAVHRRVRRRAGGGHACTPAPAAPTARTGPRCCSACTCAGPTARGFKVELLEATPGEEAGLKSATFTLTGDNAYGIMQAEKGVHRLVRLSPFDSAHRRHTSFAQVEVAPLVEDDVDVEIDEGDLRDRHLPGAGRRRPARQQDRFGRAHHAPADRDRRAVPERALPAAEQGSGDAHPQEPPDRARARADASRRWPKERGEAQDISFGSQIRSYVLHPYTMVNDHRTNMKIGNAQGVLDGDLDELIHA